MAFTAMDLDKAACQVPGCTKTHADLYFHSRCHPKKGTTVRYLHGRGILMIACKQCSAFIVEIAVAPGQGFVQ